MSSKLDDMCMKELDMDRDLNWNALHGRRYSNPGEKSRTKQSDALASDVNSIVSRHIAHKVPLPNGEGVNYAYGDFSDYGSFHDSINRVREAEKSFRMLPSHIRKHCHNDPGEFLDMVYDPERRKELEELGLVPVQMPKDAAPEPPVADPVNGNVD